MRQIYPQPAVLAGRELADAELAGRYAYLEASGGRPWLRANMVASVDGAAALGGRSGGLSGRADRDVFALLRTLADVILVGAGTARVEGYRPVSPAVRNGRWAWLREGRPPSAPIAVVTRGLDLDPAGPLLAAPPGHARTIVITTQSAPASQRSAVAATAEVIVAGHRSVDVGAAVDALAARGYRRLLTEGGPQLLSQFITAGLLDELCLTISPLLAGPGASRIAAGPPPAAADGTAAQLSLAHVLADEGHLLCRYLRLPGPPPQPAR